MFSELARRSLSGVGVSPGVGVGKCLLVKDEKKETAERKGSTSKPNASEEAQRFKSASDHVKRELQDIRVKVDKDAGKEASAIFEAQSLILADPLFIDDVNRRILSNGLTAEEAVRQTTDSLQKKFSSLTSEYMQERGEDVRDVGLRVLDVLKGENTVSALTEKTMTAEGDKVVLVSVNLTPSTIAQFDRNMLAGIITETGSQTSHLAIVAKSLRIPAVLKVKSATTELKESQVIVVNGDTGQVIADPSQTEVNKFQCEMASPVASPSPYSQGAVSCDPTETIDGHRIQVFANVSDLEGVKEAARSGAEGIGLFRTEFLYLNRRATPNEDELCRVLKEATSIMPGRTIIVRTLDIGGDKKPDYLEFPIEKNPALGLRGTRFCLANPSLLKTQIAAILRSDMTGHLWIMFPMISTLQEVREARRLIEEVKSELEQRKTAFNTSTKIGIMVETPSAALISDKLANEVDFFSIGTNDLVQYTLAADRENENLSAIADPLEPSVLKLVHQTIDNAHLSSRHVGMCGEMAADLNAIPILLGMGLDEFSVNPSNLQKLRKTIKSLKYHETKEVVKDVLSLESAAEVREYSRKRFLRQRQ